MPSRREILRWGLEAGGLVLAAGLGAPLGARPQTAAQTRRAGAGGFELIDVIPFADEGRGLIGVLVGEGRDGRRAFDISVLTSKRLTTPNDRFFVRTRHPADLDSRRPWKIAIGEPGSERTLGLDELQAMSVPLGTHLLECAGSTRLSGFGLMSSAAWEGVPLAALFERYGPVPEGRRVLVSGVEPEAGAHPGGSWIFTPHELVGAGAGLALRMNGEPLPPDHGDPVRLVVPGWYGCCWVKWVDRIAFVADGADATSQMREFAGRTHQRGQPARARDFAPATIDQAAMPVRIEMWRGPEGLFYRLVGIAWGGSRPAPELSVRLGGDSPWVPLESYTPGSNTDWTLWSHLWRPAAPGRYAIELRFDDPTVRTRRMDAGYYLRSVDIPAPKA